MTRLSTGIYTWNKEAKHRGRDIRSATCDGVVFRQQDRYPECFSTIDADLVPMDVFGDYTYKMNVRMSDAIKTPAKKH